MRIVARLMRLRLSLANGLAASAGWLLFPGGSDPAGLAAAFSGVALLAAGSSALNQVMERDLDAVMARTRRRPLPRGDLTPTSATVIGLACCAVGTGVLAAAGGAAPALLGLFAAGWYLGIYTPLKRKTAFAVVIGALSGAVPPIIGWTMAGGGPADYRILLLAGLFYLWQVPHFWLLQYRHREDYLRAGLPLPPFRNQAGFLATLLLWTAAVSVAALLPPALGAISGPSVWLYFVPVLPLLRSTARLVLKEDCRGQFIISRHSSRDQESSSPLESLT